jgi:AcrR family transcriptional regulator
MSDQPSRRAEYAEMTQHAVVAAALELFKHKGYARTTVEEIAALARVSPATVYAQCGGKSGLLETLTDVGTSGPVITDTQAACLAAPTAREKLAKLAEAYLAVYRSSGDILRIVQAAASSSPHAAAFLAEANRRQKHNVGEIIDQISEMGELSDGLNRADAINIIFWLFRYDQIALAVEDFGWTEAQTQDWIGARMSELILKH